VIGAAAECRFGHASTLRLAAIGAHPGAHPALIVLDLDRF